MSGPARRVEPGLDRGPACTVLVDGRPVTAHPGETLAAALLAAGVQTFGSSPVRGEPRGYWCGMGLCHECAVTVDGVPGVRACLTEIRPGMQVQTG
jgi:D-hydroxyproline dehydrogenase subunit gamma